VAPALSANNTGPEAAVPSPLGGEVPRSGSGAWTGDAVTIGQVLAELNAIRRKFAQKDAGDEDHPHPRNCVMTLVAVAANEADERRAQRACKAIAAHHPSLAIVVRDEPQVRSGRIDASITTHTQQPTYSEEVQFELVTLHVHGAAGEHLAALVDPLLLSGVPTYLWWLGTPPFGTAELNDTLRICDALVLDSAHFERPYHSFLGLSELAMHSHTHLGVLDFEWARLAPWREAIAQFFAPADRHAFLSGIAEVGIDYSGEGRGNRVAASLLLGWYAAQLGWKLQRAVGGSGGVVSAQFSARGWRTVDVAFRSVLKAHLGPGGVAAVRIAGAAGARTFRLSIERDPERRRQVGPELGALTPFQQLHPTGGEDDAGREIAERRAAQHRETVVANRDMLHHTATGDAPGESLPRHPTVAVRERRRDDTSTVLLTRIDIGEAPTLRQVQRVEPEDEVTLLMKLLSIGARDDVYGRSLAAAAELMRSL